MQITTYSGLPREQTCELSTARIDHDKKMNISSVPCEVKVAQSFCNFVSFLLASCFISLANAAFLDNLRKRWAISHFMFTEPTFR